MAKNDGKICEYCGCTENIHFNSKFNGYLCRKHTQQYHKKGYCYESYLEPNKFEINGNITYIFATNPQKEIQKIIIDTSNLDKLKNYKWYITKEGYALNRRVKFMHRFLMGNIDKNLYIDHINHNRLDNRLSNLRIVTAQQNAWNSSSFHGKSKFKGVKVVDSDSRYIYYTARGILNNKSIHIGEYETELEAAYAHNLWIKEHYGEYANENIFTEEEWNILQKLLPLRTVYQKKKEKASSKYKYVNYNKRDNKWEFCRVINKKRYRGTYFKTEEDAHNAYIQKMNEIGVIP